MNEIKLYEIPREPAFTTVTFQYGTVREMHVINFDPAAVAEHHGFNEALENVASLIVLKINGALAIQADPRSVLEILTLIAAHFELQFSNYLPRKMK